MIGIGPVEILIISLIALGSIVFPVALLVLLFLIYDKVRRIEQALDQLRGRDKDVSTS